ncbi:cysteine desulfurase family protein [Aquiluna sp. KACHI24]|uniref:cysteine desulfurase family protein n=1 Tax=Aquiluna sp. KACHI24 TaxID=2968831 RepID=UPI00220876DD|nr:cysteine desulfurase family protein [Aquiluna sp. KACHI24]BDQ00489.1 cysteine desulfurase [Aquiluna sp. KACHI24]
MRVFLDHASTTPVRPAAIEALSSALQLVGNPSSVHTSGQGSRAVLEDARDLLANLAGADRNEVVFLSGGTEANNQAIKGLYWASGKRLIISSPTEHHAVLDPILWLQEHEGAEVIWLDVATSGEINLDQLREIVTARKDEIAFISLMWVNNETGVITDIDQVVRIAQGIPVHCDAVAAFGHLPINFKSSGLASMAISGHKFGAPIGVGALFVSRSQKPTPLLHGGSQERSLRSGTMSYPLAAALSAAAQAAMQDREEREAKLGELRDHLEREVQTAFPEVIKTSVGANRIAHTSNLIFPGAQSDSLLFLLDQQGISASSGSACTAGVLAPSHVLTAMGYDPELADCAIRITLGHTTTLSDIESFLNAIKLCYPIALRDGANQKAI